MKKTLLFAVMFAMSLGFYSCGDDDNPVSGTQIADYFLLHLTANWTSEVYTVDSETGQNTGDAEYVFTEINREATISNESCYEFTAWDYDYMDTKGKSNPTYNYFYTENNKLYTHSSLLNRYLGGNDIGDFLPVTIPDGWLLFIDGDNDNWEMLSLDVDDFDIEYLGQGGTVQNAALAVTGSQAGDDALSVDGADYECKKYVITFALTGDLDIGIPGTTFPLAASLDMTLWLGKDVGMLKQTLSPFDITVEGQSLMTFDGSSSTVIEFDLNK